MAEDGLVGGYGFTHAWNGLFRNDEQVNGRLRLDIVEHDAEIVLMLDFGGGLAVDNFLEKRFYHGWEKLPPEHAEYTEESG